MISSIFLQLYRKTVRMLVPVPYRTAMNSTGTRIVLRDSQEGPTGIVRYEYFLSGKSPLRIQLCEYEYASVE